MICIVVPAGFVMSATYGPSFTDRRLLPLHELASQIHHTVGFLVLAVGVTWWFRRTVFGRPSWAAELSTWQRVSASMVHFTILALIIVVPWSGWAALSSLADSPQFGPTHLWFFGTDRLLPRIWTPLAFNDPAGYRAFASVHASALWLGLGLLLVHIGSALWHHFVRRDGVLRRMWPLADTYDSSVGPIDRQ